MVKKPLTGNIINSAPAVPGAWFSLDVSSYVTTDGTYSFIIDEQGNTAGKLKTKESGKAPYLEIIHQ
jgi:hypothetical protein